VDSSSLELIVGLSEPFFSIEDQDLSVAEKPGDRRGTPELKPAQDPIFSKFGSAFDGRSFFELAERVDEPSLGSQRPVGLKLDNEGA
jgi:hypothetical protein